MAKNEQPAQTPWRGPLETRGPMQLHRLHRLKAGPDLRPAQHTARGTHAARETCSCVPRELSQL